MPATPKPPGQRRRRNKEQPQWRKLPVSAPKKRKVPPLPGEIRASPVTRRWWKTVWASPMAAMWLDADVPLVERGALLVEGLYGSEEGLSQAMWAELRQIEDRLGLSPRARRTLMWEIEQAGVVGDVSVDAEADESKDDERFLKLVGD